jgi:hypothetical protein
MKLNAEGRSSDLLPGFRPSHPDKSEQWQIDWKSVIELTAAGQLQIYTVFPFNSGCKAGNQKRCKSNKIKQDVKCMMENGGFNRKS